MIKYDGGVFMNNPCEGCNHAWKISGVVSCSACCDKYLLYKEVLAVMKHLISEEEYDKLPDITQSNYWYCDKCFNYILRSWSKKCECWAVLV